MLRVVFTLANPDLRSAISVVNVSAFPLRAVTSPFNVLTVLFKVLTCETSPVIFFSAFPFTRSSRFVTLFDNATKVSVLGWSSIQSAISFKVLKLSGAFTTKLATAVYAALDAISVAITLTLTFLSVPINVSTEVFNPATSRTTASVGLAQEPSPFKYKSCCPA